VPSSGRWSCSRQAAIDASQWSLDLKLRYRPPAEIDRARFDLWAARLTVDAAAGDAAAVNGDLFTLDYIRDRILHTLDGADATRVNSALEELQTAVDDEDLAAASDAAERLREILKQLQAWAEAPHTIHASQHAGSPEGAGFLSTPTSYPRRGQSSTRVLWTCCEI
jgi:hypothetical protein